MLCSEQSIVSAPHALHTTPELNNLSPDLGPISPGLLRPFMSEMSLVEMGDEQDRLQVVKGRLDALRNILTQLRLALNSLNETHVYVAGQVRDLESYISGPASTDVSPSDSKSATAVETKAIRSRGLTRGKFLSKLHLNLVSIFCQVSKLYHLSPLSSNRPRSISAIPPFCVASSSFVCRMPDLFSALFPSRV